MRTILRKITCAKLAYLDDEVFNTLRNVSHACEHAIVLLRAAYPILPPLRPAIPPEST